MVGGESKERGANGRRSVRGGKALRAAGLLVMLAVGASHGPAAAQTPPAPVPSAAPAGTVDAARATALAGRVRALLERIGTSSVGAITNRLQTEVGASGSNCGTVKAALALVDRKGLSASATAALDALAGSADLCAGLGTGAITQGQTLSQPTTLGLPGGTSNYQ